MKKTILIFLHILVMCLPAFTEFMGKYRTRVESIKDIEDIPRDKIDWKLSFKRVNRTEQILYGYIKIKEEVGPLKMTINLEKWVDGGFKKFLIDGMTLENICVDEHYKTLMGNYNGTLRPDCIFPPGDRYLRPMSINDEMHRHVKTLVYGKFRVNMRFSSKGRDVMGMRIVLVHEKL